MNLRPWSLDLKIIASVFHSTAIASTVFRLMCRWHMARFWWEDGCAALALVLDIVSMTCVWLEAPMTAQSMPPIDNITNWIVSMTFPSVLWVCRMSILFSIVRVANPSPQLRRFAFFVGCSFVIMWLAMLAQRIQICVEYRCKIAGSAGISQLITDAISDSILVAMPIRLLRRTRLTRRQRRLIYPVFSATSIITALTILHSIVLLTTVSSGIIVIGHVKTAVSLVVCNLLVIVSFVYRVIGHDKSFNFDESDERIEFTTVDLNTGNSDSSAGDQGKRTFQTQTNSSVSGSAVCSVERSLSTTQSAEVEKV